MGNGLVETRAARVVMIVMALALGLSACGGGKPAKNGSNGSNDHHSAAADSSAITVTPGKDATDVNPTTHVVVKAPHATLTSVTMTNPEGEKVSGAFSDDKTTWTSNEDLGYAKTYSISASAKNSDGKTTTTTSSFTTLKPAKEVFPSFYPNPQTHDVGVGEPLRITFDQKVTDRAAVERALTVTANPPTVGSWHWVSNKEVRWRPKEYWKPGTKVTVNANLYGVNAGNGIYGQLDRTLTFTIHDSWIAKADAKTEHMQIFHNGKLVKTMAVSMGKNKTPTHNGPHVVMEKYKSYIMDSSTFGVGPGDPGHYRSLEKWASRISNDGEFVHENSATVGVQGSANVSHGCINLNEADAMWFYNHFNQGDVVEVVNSIGKKLPIWDGFGDWELSFDQYKAGSALN